MAGDDAEIAYCHAVEDAFAVARGLPHTLSPKDMHLVRSWWSDGVPLEAVTMAIAEVFARRRERGEEELPVSLGYCRHAVRRQARRLAAMRIGEAAPETSEKVDADALSRLRNRLQEAAERAASLSPLLPELIRATGAALEGIDDLAPAALDEHIYNLESELLRACLGALPEADRSRIEASADAAAVRSGATGDARQRAVRAMVDRELRELLGLPRFELA